MKLVQSNCTGTCCTCTGPVSVFNDFLYFFYLRGRFANLKIPFGFKHSWSYAIDHAESEYHGRYG